MKRGRGGRTQRVDKEGEEGERETGKEKDNGRKIRRKKKRK